MPLALPSSAPSLGAVADFRRRNAPVHAARQVANNDSKTHIALVQQAVNALQNCAGKDAELLQHPTKRDEIIRKPATSIEEVSAEAAERF